MTKTELEEAYARIGREYISTEAEIYDSNSGQQMIIRDITKCRNGHIIKQLRYQVLSKHIGVACKECVKEAALAHRIEITLPTKVFNTPKTMFVLEANERGLEFQPELYKLALQSVSLQKEVIAPFLALSFLYPANPTINATLYKLLLAYKPNLYAPLCKELFIEYLAPTEVWQLFKTGGLFETSSDLGKLRQYAINSLGETEELSYNLSNPEEFKYLYGSYTKGDINE